jgi:hypothetical protein
MAGFAPSKMTWDKSILGRYVEGQSSNCSATISASHIVERAMTMNRPTIAIVGLKNNQQNAVEAACHKLAKLDFIDFRHPSATLANADHVILMPRFIPHRWTKVAYSKQNRRRVHLHRGGITRLVEKIESICA